MNGLSSAQFDPLVSRNLGYERLTFALKLYCGRGRRYSVAQLAEASGVPARSIECALYQPHQAEFRPLRWEYILSIASVLKAGFASALLECVGLGAFELMGGEPPLPGVLASADTPEPIPDKRRRLIRELAALEDE